MVTVYTVEVDVTDAFVIILLYNNSNKCNIISTILDHMYSLICNSSFFIENMLYLLLSADVRKTRKCHQHQARRYQALVYVYCTYIRQYDPST